MTRAIHFVQVLAILAIAVGGFGFPVIPSAVASVVQPEPATAFDRVAACFNERRHLAVLALVDESTSLRGTDPEARRVPALVGMLRTLARYGKTTEGGQAGTVEIQLAGFGTAFSPGRWTTLTEATIGELESQAREFAGRNARNDTDFAAALLGAQETLVAKDADVTAAGRRQPCRLVLLFTDGVYELGTTGKRPYAPDVAASSLGAITDRGRHFLCDPGQLADQLRAAGSVIVAIGLVPDRPGRNGPPDQTFLQSVAERTAPGRTCGESTATPGKYVAASGLNQLLAAFDAAIANALGGTSAPGDPNVPVCSASGSTDSRCERTFALDASLREFHMLLNLAAPGIEVELRSPSGDQVRLRAGQRSTFTLGGAPLTTSPLAELDLVVDGLLPGTSTDWVGTWTVRFIDTTGQNLGAVARSQITVFGGLDPVTRPAPPEFQVGEQTDFDIRIVDAAGSPRTPADFVRSVTVTAVLIDPEGRQTDVSVGPVRPDGTYAAHYRVPDDTSASYSDLRLTLAVVTNSGLRLQPKSTTYRVPVKQPSAYPTINPLELVLTPIINEGQATGSITVTGGRGGRGCARFEQAEFSSTPANSGRMSTRYTPAANESCVRVDPNQRVTVEVAVRPEHVRTGLADGRIAVLLTTDNEKSRTVLIPVRFQSQHPVDVQTRATYFAVIVVAGVLLPLLLLWLMSWLTARFVAPRELRRAECQVVVTPAGVTAAQNSRPVGTVIGKQSFVAMPENVPPGRARRFACGILSFRRRIPLLPWTLPYAEVRTGNRLVLSSTGLGRRDMSAARVGFELNNTWVFAVEQNLAGAGEAMRVLGSLFLFVSDFDIAEKAARLLGDVEHQLPARVEAAAERIQDIPQPNDEPAPDEPPTDSDVYVPPSRRRRREH